MAETKVKEKITRSEYLQVLGLFTATRRHVRLAEELIAALGEILGDPTDNAGYIGDRVWRNELDVERQVNEMLEAMKITAEPEDANA